MKRALASSGVHPDSERKLAVFTDFWYVVTRFQLLRGFSDNALANLLEIDGKTVRNWRKSIVTSSVLQDLIDLYDMLKRVRPDICDQVRQRLIKSLSEQLNALQKPVSQKLGTRSSGLPAFESFKLAVLGASREIFDPYFHDMSGHTLQWTINGNATPSALITSLSDQLAKDLVDLYQSTTEADLAWYRSPLEASISRVASIAGKLGLQGEIDLHTGWPTDTSKLAAELVAEVAAAKVNARAYAGKIYRQIKCDDIFSERAAFRGRLALGEGLFQANRTPSPNDPLHPVRLAMAERDLLIRLDSLIDEIACVHVRKG